MNKVSGNSSLYEAYKCWSKSQNCGTCLTFTVYFFTWTAYRFLRQDEIDKFQFNMVIQCNTEKQRLKSMWKSGDEYEKEENWKMRCKRRAADGEDVEQSEKKADRKEREIY